MRRVLIVLWIMLCSATSAVAQLSIGINLPLYPDLVPVPGYPVYHAPHLEANYFFYDGLYWGTCAGGKSDGMPETLNQTGTNSG